MAAANMGTNGVANRKRPLARADTAVVNFTQSHNKSLSRELKPDTVGSDDSLQHA